MAFGTRIIDILYTGGQPSQQQVSQLPAEGFRRIFDLRPPTEDHGFDEPLVAARANLTYLSLPIASETDLTTANVRTLDQWLGDPAQPKVLVHCASSNRVGALLALRAHWLHGSGEEAALAIGRAAGLKGLEPAVRGLLARSTER